jgi:hypothetical protein
MFRNNYDNDAVTLYELPQFTPLEDLKANSLGFLKLPPRSDIPSRICTGGCEAGFRCGWTSQ